MMCFVCVSCDLLWKSEINCALALHAPGWLVFAATPH